MGVAFYLTRVITKPISKLTQAAISIGRGGMTTKVDIKSPREVGALAHSFNEMVASLKKSERRYRTTLDNMLEGCQIIDRKWRYVYLNDTAAQHGRRPKEELLGRTMMEVYPGIEKSEMFVHLKHCMGKRVSHRMENEFVYPDGSKGWFDLSFEPVEEGVFILSLDITERKRAEVALKQWGQELEERVQQRTAELEQRGQELTEANVRLEELSLHKSQFLANMSHELRTPLNSIIGYTKLMLDGLEGKINEEQKQDLQTVYKNSQHLLNLINDLLDLSRIEAGKVKVEYEAFTIAELLDEALPSIKWLAQDKGLTLDYKVDPAINHIYADKAKTKQTLINILANAVKFTEKGGIKLNIAESDGEIVFSVSDTGMGIKKEDLAVIFDSFTQVGPAQIAGFEGTGLGLAISKQFVEMQGGRIWAESQPGKGSTFYFTLPKKKAPRR
jgi:PAS domain S-box-containing protein